MTEATLLERERRLPLEGEVLVNEGDQVYWDKVVARTDLPGRVDMVNVANKLGLEPTSVPNFLFKKVGDSIEKGEPLAQNDGFFGFFRSTLRAPMSGTVESVSEITGQVILRAPPRLVEIQAYCDGVIEKVLANQGVVVKTYGTFIQGIFGIGGETSGHLVMVADSPDQPLSPEQIEYTHKGKIVVAGSLVTVAGLEKAVKVGVRGVIAGGIHDQDLRDFLGYDLGVAITGSERKGLTLVITEGFGPITMARRTFDLLSSKAGKRASLSGATQIRAGVMRPEVIIPELEGDWQESEAKQLDLELAVGAPVRVIREPNFGRLAKVTALPVEPEIIPSEAKVRVATVEFDNGESMTLPRANLELIEG